MATSLQSTTLQLNNYNLKANEGGTIELKGKAYQLSALSSSGDKGTGNISTFSVGQWSPHADASSNISCTLPSGGKYLVNYTSRQWGSWAIRSGGNSISSTEGWAILRIS